MTKEVSFFGTHTETTIYDVYTCHSLIVPIKILSYGPTLSFGSHTKLIVKDIDKN